jgi:excisionase family DNA binding protein
MTTAESHRSYLVTVEVAEFLRCSVRRVHELTRRRAIPHRRVPGTRRCLFVERELHLWLDGAELDVVELPDHGRIVSVAQRL